jgi:hypothetical protein
MQMPVGCPIEKAIQQFVFGLLVLERYAVLAKTAP